MHHCSVEDFRTPGQLAGLIQDAWDGDAKMLNLKALPNGSEHLQMFHSCSFA